MVNIPAKPLVIAWNISEMLTNDPNIGNHINYIVEVTEYYATEW